MGKTKSWSGNDTTDISLADDSFEKIKNFCQSHDPVYIFGDGQIGAALAHYMKNAEIPYAGHLTSATLGAVKQGGGRNPGIILGVNEAYYAEVLPALRDIADERDLLFPPRELTFNLQFQSPLNVRNLFHLIIFTTTACNLYCKSCSTFAPVVRPAFYEYGRFAEDLLKFRGLNIERLNVIKFTGGEPLLHNDLFRMFSAARELFPDTPIECYTNGSLLGRLTDEQLALLRRLDVTPVITEYPPLGNTLSAFYGRAEAMGLSYHVIFAENQKFFSKRPLGFEKSTPKHLYAACPRFKYCSVFLYNGRLFKCVYCMLAGDFNEAFNQSLRLEDGDCLDLGRTGKEELFNFLITRKPFCGYCRPITERVPWGLSERKIDEWTERR